MADFRRWIPVLALLAIVLGVAATANAQPQGAFTCIATGGVSTLLRQESYVEQTGDIVINCTGGFPKDPGAVVPTVNVQIFLPQTNITSRLLENTTDGTEALLMIDEPAPAAQKVCAVGVDCAGGNPPTLLPYIGVGAAGQACEYNNCGAPAGLGTPYNIWQGARAADNSVVFNNVPIDPPGTAGPRVIRITNIRANATFAPRGTVPTTLFALISASPPQSLPITNNAQQVVGLVLSGLAVTQTASVANGQQCFGSFFDDGEGGTTLVDGGSITFTETFASSFKTRTINGTGTTPLDQNIPGAIYNTESAFYDVNSGNTFGLQAIAGTAPAGVADFGTRFRVVFTNLQAGLTVTAPTVIFMNSLTGKLCMTASETGPFSPIGGCGSSTTSTSFTATASSSTTEFVYEVVAAETGVTERAFIPFNFSWSGPPNQPALGTNNIVGWFAPTPVAPPDPSKMQPEPVPIPRFVDFSTPIADLTIVKCATHLLFPYVTDAGGFDTGLAISNTSTDPYGTTPQSGTCTLSFFGDNAPSACITTGQNGCSATGGPDIPSGTTWSSTVFGLSFLNFQGYVIADCEFQYAHGFAFVTKVGATDVAMGYLALIIPDSPTPNNRHPDPFTIKGANSGEQLGY